MNRKYERKLILERDDDCEDCPGWLRWRVVQLDVWKHSSRSASTQAQVLHHSMTKLGARWWLWLHYRGVLYYIQN